MDNLTMPVRTGSETGKPCQVFLPWRKCPCRGQRGPMPCPTQRLREGGSSTGSGGWRGRGRGERPRRLSSRPEQERGACGREGEGRGGGVSVVGALRVRRGEVSPEPEAGMMRGRGRQVVWLHSTPHGNTYTAVLSFPKCYVHSYRRPVCPDGIHLQIGGD